MYEVERLRQLGYNLNSKYLVHSIENYSYISSNGLGEFKYTINFTLKEDLKKDLFIFSLFPVEKIQIIEKNIKLFENNIEKLCNFNINLSNLEMIYVFSLKLECNLAKNRNYLLLFNIKYKNSLDNPDKLYKVLKRIYGETSIANFFILTRNFPVMRYSVWLKYEGFEISRSELVITDKINQYGKPENIIYKNDIKIFNDEVRATIDFPIPDTAYVILTKLCSKK
ncbi:hypothetical protein D1867_10685 [Acidianus infernus]|uniref:Uncharacterized protein n=1 Tax=Acidianus infernus TaxID=12915 RepID=A0A6A9QP65_ACIIN|nr:hypothetical protein [Acidianus infernus]MUM65698.1 hypothetical protein [Acidianus infernus]